MTSLYNITATTTTSTTNKAAEYIVLIKLCRNSTGGKNLPGLVEHSCRSWLYREKKRPKTHYFQGVKIFINYNLRKSVHVVTVTSIMAIIALTLSEKCCLFYSSYCFNSIIHHSFFQIYLALDYFSPLREIRVASPGKGNNSRKSSATHSYQCVWYFRVFKQRHGCQCWGSLTGVYILMDAIAHEGSTDTVRESALKVDSGKKNPLPHRGIEPASSECRSDTLATELHPRPMYEEICSIYLRSCRLKESLV